MDSFNIATDADNEINTGEGGQREKKKKERKDRGGREEGGRVSNRERETDQRARERHRES